MNGYITLDGYKYATLQRSWRPNRIKSATLRGTLLGAVDVTYGALTLKQWQGEIVGDIVARDTGWGTIATLRTTFEKRTGLSYTDHYGNVYTVHAIGELPEESFHPGWDSNSNKIYVAVLLVGA